MSTISAEHPVGASNGIDPAPTCPQVSIVVPVYNEKDNIVPFLAGIRDRVRSDAEILIVYDFDEDNTLPAVREMAHPPPGIRFVKNTLGRGVVNALKTGLRAARAPAVVVTMADCSDEPQDIDRLAERIYRGADVVAGSRYMRGGRQIGGPLLKRTLSRLAGKSLHAVAGLPIHDATTNFRAYSARVVRELNIESAGGFEVAMELTIKAWSRGWRIEEIPSTWRDRTAGEARFRLWKWLPRYLRWYVLGLHTGLLKPGRVPNRRQVALLLGVLALMLAGAYFRSIASMGTVITPASFSPLAPEGRDELGWAMIRPLATLSPDTPKAREDDPAPDQYMTVLRSRAADMRVSAPITLKGDTIEVWVSSPNNSAEEFRLDIEQAGRTAPLIRVPQPRVTRHKTAWSLYAPQDALLAGDARLVLTARPEGNDQIRPHVGDILVREPARNPPFPPVSTFRQRTLRTASLGLGFVALGLFTRFGKRVPLLLVSGLALGHFVDLYLPTARWGISDDDWHMLGTHSAVLDGRWSVLLTSHNGHVVPAYRLLRHACYLLAGLDGTLVRAINAASMIAAAVLLGLLLHRWTRSAFAAGCAAAVSLTTLGITIEPLCLTSCNPAAFGATAVVLAMYSMERFLRSGHPGWLGATGLGAAMAPLLFAAGVVVFPALVFQYAAPLRRARLSARNRAALFAAFSLAFVAFSAAYWIGLRDDARFGTFLTGNAATASTERGVALGNIREIAQRCGEAFLFAGHVLAQPGGFSRAVGAAVLAALALPLVLPGASKRARWVALVGVGIMAVVYGVVFAFRSQYGAAWPRHHVVAYVGFTCVIAATLCAIRRRPGWRVAFCVLLLLVIRIAWQMDYALLGQQTWAYLFDRQDRVLQSVVAAGAGSDPVPPRFASSDRVLNMTAGEPVRLGWLADLVARRSCSSAPRVAAPDLNNVALRHAYRLLAAQHLVALRPDGYRHGSILLGWPGAHLPSSAFLVMEKATSQGSEDLAWLELPNGIERVEGRWHSWLPGETRLAVYCEHPCTAKLEATLRAGPSSPGPAQTITVKAGGRSQTWGLKDAGTHTFEADFALPAGTTVILISVRESRAVAPQPGGDPRDLMLFCEGLRILLSENPPR